MMDLNTLIDPLSGWTLNIANDINDTGWIVGYGTVGGKTHAFLLTPEPATLSLLALGALALISRKRSIGK
jgi:probable HAF family extracellular repeat protein